jgi:hypothetical protein
MRGTRDPVVMFSLGAPVQMGVARIAQAGF